MARATAQNKQKVSSTLEETTHRPRTGGTLGQQNNNNKKIVCFKQECANIKRGIKNTDHILGTLHSTPYHLDLYGCCCGNRQSWLLWFHTGSQPSTTQPLSLPLLRRMGRKTTKKLMGWDRRSLTNYLHGQNRLSIREINLIYCQLITDWSRES